jgi:hypothetical protein
LAWRLQSSGGVAHQATLTANDSKSRAAARPQPRPAAGVKIAVGVIAGILALFALSVWGLVRAVF